jgi:hypothetical protein
MNAKSLVDEIKQCLKNNAPEQDIRRLGAEYLTSFNEASGRLQRCVDLIRQGKESTALQEAQFAPPLMEVLEAFSFPQVGKWAEEMGKCGMPAPAPLDGKQISMMGELFAKPIDGTDPLYSDLAHAMRTKDLPKALNVLRIIRRKNPSDSNAATQLAKIEKGIQNEKIAELARLAREQNEGWFTDAMSAFNSEPWENQPEGGEWNEVAAYAEAIRREDCLERCKAMIENLLSIRKNGTWKDAVGLLAQIEALVAENGFGLEENLTSMPEHTYKGIIDLARKWIAKEKEKERKGAEDKEREDELKVVIRSIQDKEIGKKRKTPELRDDLAALTSVARDLEQAGQSLSEEDLKNFNRCLLKLREEIAKRQKNFRIMIATACVIAISIAGVSFYFISERLRWNEQFETLAGGLKSNQNPELLEKFLDSFEKKHPERAAEIEFAAEIKKGRASIIEARQFRDRFEERIQTFEDQVKEATDLKAISQLQGEKNLLREDLNGLNAAYREKSGQALMGIELKWNDKRDQMQTSISGLLASKMNATSDFAEKKLGIEQSPQLFKENLDGLNKLLVDLETESAKYSGVEGLGLTVGQKDILVSLRNSYDKNKEAVASYDEAVATLGKIDSVETLLDSLETIISSGFVGSAHYQAAKKTLLSRTLFSDLEAKAFMPENPQKWQTGTDSITARYKSEEIVPKEAAPLNALYNEERLKEIYSSKFFSSDQIQKFEKTGESWQPMSKGSADKTKWTIGNNFPIDLTFKQGVVGSGSYELSQTAKVITGQGVVNTTFKSLWGGISRTFEIIESSVTVKGDLVLGDPLTPEGSTLSPESEYLYGKGSKIMETYSPPKVNKPPLMLLDSLKAEKLDPFVKCHIFMALMKSMGIRPHEWGLKNNPLGSHSAQTHYEQLTKAVGGQDLISEWYGFLSSGKETELRKQLLGFFAREARNSYFKEARFYEKFWRELLSAKFEFRGYCTLDGKWSKPVKGYAWGLSAKDNTLKIVQEKKEGYPIVGAVPYSPVMILDKKFSEILSNARSHAGFESPNDADYLRIKKSLPYPFHYFPEE